MSSFETQAVRVHPELGLRTGLCSNGDKNLGSMYAAFLQTLKDLLTLLEVDIIGNEWHAILHFQTRMAHLVQNHHAYTFVM